MADRVFNFYAGPATLPYSVIQKAAESITNFQNLGLSILEISHRAKEFDRVIKEAQADMKALMNLGDDYHVLFLQGGASLQFHMVPLNLRLDGKPTDYVNTGAWAKKAIKEARLLGETRVVASSEDDGFSYVPNEIPVNPDASYLHVTSNNTIFGTQMHTFPETGDVPLVADMSSDMLCRRLDYRKFSLIYAGAQKNMGPAGTTIVVIKDDMVQRAGENLPTLLSYRTHVDKDSLFNTPSVYAVYVVHLVLKWIMEQGGLDVIEQTNKQKAAMLYDAIDSSNGYFRPAVTDPDSRSWMNVTFRLPTKELEQSFVAEAAERGMIGLKGHRSVGGIRASIYNAFPMEGVERLVAFMKEFKTHN